MWLRCSEQGANDDNDDNVTSSLVLLSLPLELITAYTSTIKFQNVLLNFLINHENDPIFPVTVLVEGTCPLPNA